MIKKEIIESNKLIAEFMDYEYTPSPVPVTERGYGEKQFGWNRKMEWSILYIKSMNYSEYPLKRYHLARTHYDLKFNSSWEWLMPVVEKINKESESPVLHFGNVNCYCEIRGKKFVAPTMIEAAHKAVVEFIKWYNEQE